jgi:hypothetical protein
MRVTLALALCTLLGCGGGGTTTPSPSTPDVSGNYGGFVTFTSATPPSHCFAAGLARLNGHGFRYRVTVQQTGSQLSGTLDNDDMGISCGFAGTVAAGGEVSWSQTTCSDPTARFSWTSEAQRSCELSVTQTGHSFTGRRLTGQVLLDWTTTDSVTGEDLGAIQVRVTVPLG